MSKKSPVVPPLTIIIPVRNEQESIIKNLLLIRNKVKVPHCIIAVNDGSTDQTVKLVLDYIKKNSNVKLIHTTPRKSGFKNAVDAGFNSAKTKYVAVVMGDLCDNPKTINDMYKKIETGWDIVVGSRYMSGGGKKDSPKLQGFLSWAVSRSLHLLTGIPTHDISNPFRMYKKKIVNSINTRFNDYEVSIEILVRAYMNGSRITETPTIWKGRKLGKSKFKLLKRIPGYAKIYLWVLLNIGGKQFQKTPIDKSY